MKDVNAGIAILIILLVAIAALTGAWVAFPPTKTCHMEIIKEKTISGGFANEYLLVTDTTVHGVYTDMYANADVGDSLEICETMWFGVEVYYSRELVDTTPRWSWDYTLPECSGTMGEAIY